jgi:hypothetical protein
VREALAAACVLVLAGCGGSDGSGDDGSWSQRADAICHRTEKAIRAIEPPEDIDDLDRVMVGASEHVRTAIGEIRKLEIPEDQQRRAKLFLDDLDVAEQDLEAIEDAAAGGERRSVDMAGQRLRLDAIDFGQHAKAAGLARCGREEVGVAAADAVLAPAFAEWIAEAHATFVGAERLVAERYDPVGEPRERAGYWVALWAVVEQTEKRFEPYAQPPERDLEAVRGYYDAFDDVKNATDYLRSAVTRQQPISSKGFTEREARRLVAAYKADGIALLEQLGPAGKAQLRALRGLIGQPRSSGPSS